MHTYIHTYVHNRPLTAAGLTRGYVILRRSGTNQLVLFGVSKYLMAAVDREEDMTPGVRSFIESWNVWICDKASTDLNKNTTFGVISHTCFILNKIISEFR